MITWVLTIALLVTDSHGFSRAMPAKLAQAILNATKDRAEQAVMVVFAFHEGSYRTDVRGDSGASCGTFQSRCAVTPLCTASSPQACFDTQARIALDTMHRSFAACPEYPLAVYASGSCTSAAGRRISTARIAEARRLEGVP